MHGVLASDGRNGAWQPAWHVATVGGRPEGSLLQRVALYSHRATLCRWPGHALHVGEQFLSSSCRRSSFPLLCQSTDVPLDGEIHHRCSLFAQLPALLAPPSSCGPLAAVIAFGVGCRRGRATMAAMGTSPWLAGSGAPLIIPFIVLAPMQLHYAHRLHSFTPTA